MTWTEGIPDDLYTLFLDALVTYQRELTRTLSGELSDDTRRVLSGRLSETTNALYLLSIS